MRKKFLFGMAVVAALMAGGCQKQEQVVTETAAESINLEDATPVNADVIEGIDATEADPEFNENYNKLTINGKEITLPMNYEDFLALGYTDLDDIGESTLDSTFGVAMTCQDEDGTQFTAVVTNYGTDTVTVKDANVNAILSEADYESPADIVFYKGISLKSTEEEIATVLTLYNKEDNTATYYKNVNYDGNQELFTKLVDGKVTSIQLYSTK